jgi:hypothetical protein
LYVRACGSVFPARVRKLDRMEDPRLSSLVDLFAAGVLSTDEEAELYHRLVASAADREQFDRHIAVLRAQSHGVHLPSARDAIHRWETPASENDIADAPPFYGFASMKLRAWCGSAAMAVLIGASLIVFLSRAPGLLPLFRPPTATSTDFLATLKNAAGVTWVGKTNEVFVGDQFAAERLQIASGAVQLDFKRGARVIVEGPAELQLVSDNEAFLHYGKVTAHVPKEAHGFKITSPRLAVIDLGTEFGLSNTSNGVPEVHVFSGAVEMARPEKAPEQMVEGEAARVKGTRVRKMAPQRSGFLFEEGLAARVEEEQTARYQLWKTAAARLSSDPAAVVHYTFENEGGGSCLNRGAASSKAASGAIMGCQWTDGRWPEKRALAFTGKTDRVRFVVPNTFTSMTYMAWLRVDQLLNSSNALALTETGQQGELHWQIYRDGRVAMSSRSGSGSTVEQTWDRGISAPIFTPDRLGKWTLLVSVYDSSARTISHYVNGEFVSASPMKRPIKLKLGAVELGNWGSRGDTNSKSYASGYYNRNLSGRLDEFALMSRALSAEEIRSYYQQGRAATGTLLARKTDS